MRPSILTRPMKRSNSILARNFVNRLMKPVKKTPEDYRRLAVELARQ